MFDKKNNQNDIILSAFYRFFVCMDCHENMWLENHRL